jgi:Tol biopolymer transport system component
VIAATSLQDGNQELYVLDPDGTNPRRLTTTAEAELFPAVSPDARRVAFIRRFGTGASAQERLVVIDVDGNNEQLLTDLLYDAANPTWSPDGQHIAFTCTLPGAWGNELCIVNADGSDLHIVLDQGGFSFVALYPDWDPTSDRIGHVPNSAANPAGEFAYVASNGAALGGVTTGLAFAISPAWSPDGAKLAFSLIAADGDVMVADAATGAVVNLTNSAGMENSPTWTRDGTGLVYELAGNLYRVSASGGVPQQLTANGLYANPHMR